MVDMFEQERVSGNAEAASSGRKRGRSLIDFPYSDLERAVELARTLWRQGGQSKIDHKQLAVAMDQSATGGTFRGRLSAAKMFGLVEAEQGMVCLTPLGLQVIEEETAGPAKAEAFLNVPLYRALFEQLNGYALPPATAIERQMESLGVPPKQKERARQAFSSSATYANYIAPNGRVTKPLAAKPAPIFEDAEPRDGSTVHGGGADTSGQRGGDKSLDLHPSLKGLVAELPPARSEWAIEDQADWLMAVAQLFKIVYKATGRIEIRVVPSRVEDGS